MSALGLRLPEAAFSLVSIKLGKGDLKLQTTKTGPQCCAGAPACPRVSASIVHPENSDGQDLRASAEACALQGRLRRARLGEIAFFRRTPGRDLPGRARHARGLHSRGAAHAGAVLKTSDRSQDRKPSPRPRLQAVQRQDRHRPDGGRLAWCQGRAGQVNLHGGDSAAPAVTPALRSKVGT